ncbi:MAG: UDP-glucose/GDP-mannose dehydrogenase family protein [Chloroflexi bacterium]|nr:UDP-glucose/GDP-mannose dehydrogenase family protein [Chloroflexota bacterium]
MNVATIGLWHLGTVTSACLASVGHRVVAFDHDAELIRALSVGRLPVAEPGLDELTRKNLDAGTLRFSADPRDLADAEVVWVTYDTPVDENDVADVEYVVQRVNAIFPHLRDDALVLISSQMPVGSTRRLAEMYARALPNGRASFAYSPENLRLGKALDVFLYPDRVVVGARTEADRARIAELFKPITDKLEWMSVESAEMTKHALNAFLATSVTFINEIASLCERVGADAREVERGLKSEARIGPKAYLRPGGAFAGGTLARDIAFLVEVGHAHNTPTNLLAAVRTSNDEHKHWARRALTHALGDLRGKTIAVLGLTYKPGTDTLRRSSAVELCHWLREQGAPVVVFDPAVKSLPDELSRVIELRDSIALALRDADAAVIATECPEFATLMADDLVRAMRQPIVLDASRFLEKNLGRDTRIRYIAVGKSQ